MKIEDSTTACAQAEVRIKQLEKALRPFAKLATAFEGNLDTDTLFGDYRGRLTIHHIRQAANALKPIPAGEDKAAGQEGAAL